MIAILTGVGDQTVGLSVAWLSSVAGRFLYIKVGGMGCSSASILILTATRPCNSCKNDDIYITMSRCFDMNFKLMKNVQHRVNPNKGIGIPCWKFLLSERPSALPSIPTR